jgi:hypothetical protein
VLKLLLATLFAGVLSEPPVTVATTVEVVYTGAVSLLIVKNIEDEPPCGIETPDFEVAGNSTT